MALLRMIRIQRGLLECENSLCSEAGCWVLKGSQTSRHQSSSQRDLWVGGKIGSGTPRVDLPFSLPVTSDSTPQVTLYS